MCTLRGRFPRPRVRRALTQESVSRNFVTLCTHRAAWLIHSSLFSIPGGMWISRRLVSLGWVAAICPDERDLVSQFRSGHSRLMRVCALRDLSLERSTRFAARLRALRDRSLGRFTRFCCVGIFGLFGTGAQVLFNLLDSCLFATIRSPCSFVTGLIT